MIGQSGKKDFENVEEGRKWLKKKRKNLTSKENTEVLSGKASNVLEYWYKPDTEEDMIVLVEINSSGNHTTFRIRQKKFEKIADKLKGDKDE